MENRNNAQSRHTYMCKVALPIVSLDFRPQSQKPEEIYELIERLVPNGRYLEIFGRKNNLRDFWVTIGNEVTGTGLPEEDLAQLEQEGRIEGAVYGAGKS